MSNRNFLGGLLTGWNSRSVRYGRISGDEEQKKTSVRFGVMSIIEALFGALFAVAGGWLLLHFSEYSDQSALIMILMLIFGVALILTALRTWICAAVDLGYQMLMNRKPVRWIALAFLIVAIVGSVAVIIVLA